MPENHAHAPVTEFQQFCRRVMGGKPAEILTTTREELKRCQTAGGSHDGASPQGIYRRQLESLAFLLEHGRIPDLAPDGFYHDVTPLVRRLLLYWNVGNLRQEFAATYGW